MNLVDALLSRPAEHELWIILTCVSVVLIGARVVEVLAHIHFLRAQRHAEQGFEYVQEEDHYRCPEGERLTLHVLEEENRMAIYQAPATCCNHCRLKQECTPHNGGRRIYRSLAFWAETDIGHFHKRLSALMFGAAVVVSSAGLWRWGGQSGTGLVFLVLAASLLFLWQDVDTMRESVLPRLQRSDNDSRGKA